MNEARTARWIKGDKWDSRYMCSRCHCKEEHVPTCIGVPNIWAYCPNCGAMMEEHMEFMEAHTELMELLERVQRKERECINCVHYFANRPIFADAQIEHPLCSLKEEFTYSDSYCEGFESVHGVEKSKAKREQE